MAGYFSILRMQMTRAPIRYAEHVQHKKDEIIALEENFRQLLIVFCDLCRLTGVRFLKMETNEMEFTRMILENKSTIYTVCYMFSKDKNEIDDLFQEVLVRLWKGYASFQRKADIKTWIYRVSLNSCIDQQKKSRRRGERVQLSVDIDPFEDTDDKALQTRQLYSRIQRLGLMDRGIILLWLEGLSYDEIAAIVGISVKNVSFRLVRIKNQLKNQSND